MNDICAGILSGEKRYGVNQHAKIMEQLASLANSNHFEVLRTFRRSLEHAKEAGDALRAAKRMTGHRTKWTKWRNKNFNGSARTARAYMRVSNKWDDIRIKRARQHGHEPESIRGFLEIVKGRSFAPEPRQPLTIDSIETLQQDLTTMFRHKVRKLDEYELNMMFSEFDDVWDATYEYMKEMVNVETGFTYYEDPDAFPMRYKRVQAYERSRKTDRKPRFNQKVGYEKMP